MKLWNLALRPPRPAYAFLTLGALALGGSTVHAQAPAPGAAPPPSAPAPTPVPVEPAPAPPAATPASPAAAPPAAPPLAGRPPTLVVPGPVVTESYGVPAAPPPPVDAAAAAGAPRATLDYSDGSFYFRSFGDNLVLMPAARAHMDVYTFAGPGASDYHRSNGTGLKPNLFFRRFILEMGGLIRRDWFFWIGGNFAPTTVDSSQAPLSSANVYDGFVGYAPRPTLRFYFGQYNAPFTMENVTSSKWLDMMERALVIRTLATPYNKADGLTVWGESDTNKTFEYQLGGFGGDGMNRMNIDGHLDAMGRFVIRPLSKRSDALKRFHFGGGFRYGRRDPSFVRYDAPTLSTPGGYAFWSPVYGSGANETHILPSKRQAAASAEFYLPFERFDLRSEVVYINEQRREVLQSERFGTNRAVRLGLLKGVGAYFQLSMWLLGTPRINGNPGGLYGAVKVPESLGTQAPYALQLVLRGEILRLDYDGNSRRGDAGGPSAQTNNIDVNVYQVALNYWATKHVRLTAEWSTYHFPGTPITQAMGADNQAAAPGRKATPANTDANSLHEISFRVGLAL